MIPKVLSIHITILKCNMNARDVCTCVVFTLHKCVGVSACSD